MLYFSHYFFFYCYGDLRDLHSFPTRRSSDLLQRGQLDAVDLDAAGARLVEAGEDVHERRLAGSGRAHDSREVAARDRERDRSEEHTSELQPRLHLVCRLLLEKKKKTKKRIMN